MQAKWDPRWKIVDRLHKAVRFAPARFRACEVTAIVAVAAPWGVLMAADGRRLVEGAKGEEIADGSPMVSSERTQKIFPLATPGVTAMCGVAGSVTGALSDGSIFDLRDELQRQATLVTADDFDGPHDYIELLLRTAIVAIGEHEFFPLGNGAHPRYGEIIAEAIFGACWGDLVCFAHAIFCHSNGAARATFIDYREDGGGRIFYGPDAVYNALYDEAELPIEGSPLRGYAHRVGKRPTESEATSLAVDYIKACCSPEGRRLDPEGCESIGGHIHVAIVKSQSGFEWIIPPLPE